MNQITETSIRKVKIFRNGCTVTRCGSVFLEAGRSRLLIAGMTGGADTNSALLRFPEGVSAENIMIVNMGDVIKEKPSDRLSDEIRDLDMQIGVKDMQVGLWEKNGNLRQGGISDAEQLEAYIDALPARLQALYDETAELNRKKKEKQKEQEEQLRREGFPLLCVDVVTEKSAECAFILEYRENTAWWEPQYEVRFEDRDKPLDVRMKARIVQNTGENWEDAEVDLYTGNPAASLEVPRVFACYLSIAVPQPARPVVDSYSGSQMPMAKTSFARGAVNNMVSQDTAPLPVIETAMLDRLSTPEAVGGTEETTNYYHLPGKWEIRSDSFGSMADIQAFKIQAQYHMIAVPGTDQAVRFAAEIAAEDCPVRNASASVYVRETYAGKTYLSPDPGKKTIFIGLGQNEHFMTSREKVDEQHSEESIRSLQTQRLHYRIRLRCAQSAAAAGTFRHGKHGNSA